MATIIDLKKPPLNELVHFGRLGMRWGVRKEQKQRERIKSRTESMSTKLKTGDTLILDGEPTPALAKILGRFSSSVRRNINNSAFYKIKNSEDKMVGEMQLYKESPTSLNVVWIGIKDKERGHGYATASMKAAIGFAKKENLKTVTLEVPGHSPDALHIYEKLGFKKVEVLSVNDAMWGGLTAMKLDLKKTR